MQGVYNLHKLINVFLRNMKLSPNEARMLQAIQFEPHLSVPEISLRVGQRTATVRRSLKRLSERGVIRLSPIINISSLALTQYEVYFTPVAGGHELRSQIVDALKNSTQVSWLYQTSGDFAYVFAVSVRDVSELWEFFDQLSKQFGNFFFLKTVGAVISWGILRRGYLSTSNLGEISRVMVQRRKENVAIDDLDHRILSTISDQGFESNRALARSLDTPASTIEYRIERMRRNRVIEQFVYTAQPWRYEMSVFRLMLFFKGVSQEIHDRLHQFSADHPNVISIVQLIGNWDYTLRLEVKDPDGVSQICDELYETFSSELNTIKSISVTRELKFSNYPFASNQFIKHDFGGANAT